MNTKKIVRIVSTALCAVIGASTFSVFAGCGKSEKDSVLVMTEELSGLFNPYYATSGADMDVVGLTQIGMLSTDHDGNTVAGDGEATVVKDFKYEVNETNTGKETVYTFVIKNGLKFSDGVPLTMNDVMFNIYELLDPVYTGSSTLYSVDIKGLSKYRYQTTQEDKGEQVSQTAAIYAETRKYELELLYTTLGKKSTNSYSMTEDEVRSAINEWYVTDGYKSAVATDSQMKEWTEADYRAKLLEDYELVLKTFKEELESDFKAAKESYDLTTDPYKDWSDKLSNDVFKFFLYEGYITPVYAKGADNKDDKSKITKFENENYVTNYPTMDAAINKVYNDKIVEELTSVLNFWGTAGTLSTQFTADATEVLLRNQLGNSGLLFPNIEGVVSLGHTTDVPSVEINGTTYSVAHTHNDDGTPTVADEYDVLQITVNGTDPKAIYNFGFTVAPAHYYGSATGDGSDVEIDIANNKFGVEWSSSSFQGKVIQSQLHVEVPVGAGPYIATNADNGDNPKGSEFWSNNVVYYKANENFMFEVKAKKFRMQVVSSANALDMLANGGIDYVTPQFTQANANRLDEMTATGKFEQLNSWQLGYGYIGINAGKIPNVYIRRAIMSAMQTSLALNFYQTGTCQNISWPMSKESWAYPDNTNPSGSETEIADAKDTNDRSYLQFTTVAAAKSKIQGYMNLAPNEDLSITFTIAGSSISEHPTYAVFKQAAQILNEMGWNVEVKADSQALTKLSTGSLEVWAAAWGSTIDPDMYQVYHKNSTATSVYSWGYREIKSNTTLYSYEYKVINALSEIIDEARTIMYDNKEQEQAERTALYKEAMELVLDMAVEMPVYQRQTLYAYNSSKIKGLPSEVNAYSSPLEKVWEIELVK